MPHLSGSCRYFFHHSYRVLSLQNCPSLAGKTDGTRIEKYRALIMPLRLRGGFRNTAPRILVQSSCSALISAFALRTLTPKSHITFISTLRISFRFGCGCPTQSKIPSRQLFIEISYKHSFLYIFVCFCEIIFRDFVYKTNKFWQTIKKHCKSIFQVL